MARPKAILKAKDAQDKHLRMMLYGEPGVGKSTFAGTSGPKTLILANELGEATSITTSGSDVDLWEIKDYDDVDAAYEYLRHEGFKEYEWVWIDNLTLFQDQCMDRIMKDLVREKPNRNQWVPDQHEYLVNQNRLSNVVRSFKKLPMHVGITAHIMKSEDDDGRVLYLPMLQGGQGALAQKICGYMNTVAFMSAARKDGKTQRKIQLAKRSKYLAKCRFAKAPAELTEPTVPLLLSSLGVTLGGGDTTRRRRTSATTSKTTTRKRAAK